MSASRRSPTPTRRARRRGFRDFAPIPHREASVADRRPAAASDGRRGERAAHPAAAAASSSNDDADRPAGRPVGRSVGGVCPQARRPARAAPARWPGGGVRHADPEPAAGEDDLRLASCGPAVARAARLRPLRPLRPLPGLAGACCAPRPGPVVGVGGRTVPCCSCAV